MSSYLITGASRGLGLGFCTALAAKPASEVSTIFAVGRSESHELQALVEAHPRRVIFVKMDVTAKTSISEAAETVKGHLSGRGLDVLINNAGVQNQTPEGVAAM
jgi:NAD(P)-dependent dehydrogenase (short-subunit alcohol dehydrogenase family)